MSRLPISALILSPPGESITEFETKPAKMQNQPNQTPQEADVVMSEPEHSITLATTPKADPARQRPPSPPESPATASRHGRDFVKVQSRLADVVDPTVVPQDQDENDDDDDDVLPDANTLFPPIHDPVDAAIHQHMQAVLAPHFVPSKSKGDKRKLRNEIPTLEEYRLAATFVASLHKQQPGPYAQKMRAADERFSSIHRIAPRPALVPIQVKPGDKVAIQPQTPRVRKTTSPTTRKVATPRIKAAPRDGESPRSGRAGTPHHTRHREPKKPIDDNWRALPDYAPSTALLDTQPRALKIDWDGNPLDISRDPDLGELHEAERNLASSLRLTCARYLTCKRRIFIARVEALRIGKEFKKTDAQQACQIDVNKASKLWLAYDRVGWLQPQLFKEYL